MRFLRAGSVSLLLVLCACSESDPNDAGTAGTAGALGTAGSGGNSAACDTQNGVFVITDDTNYTLPSSLAIERKTLKDATDVTFDWGSLTRDLYGKPLDAAADIDQVVVSLWNMTPDELESRLEKDALPRSENIGAVTVYPDGSSTSANLLSFNLQGNPIPEEDLWGYFDTQSPKFAYPQDRYTFLAVAASGTVIDKGARMLSFFTLDPSSPNTKLSFENGSTELAFEANLVGARAMRVPRATPSISVDWSEMTVNALGNEFLPVQITEAAVAHFPNASLETLENDFINLQDIAGGWWSGKVKSGRSIELGTLRDENDTTFPGIDAQDTWLVALFCTGNCSNPAPWSITILKPCD